MADIGAQRHGSHSSSSRREGDNRHSYGRDGRESRRHDDNDRGDDKLGRRRSRSRDRRYEERSDRNSRSDGQRGYNDLDSRRDSARLDEDNDPARHQHRGYSERDDHASRHRREEDEREFARRTDERSARHRSSDRTRDARKSFGRDLEGREDDPKSERRINGSHSSPVRPQQPVPVVAPASPLGPPPPVAPPRAPPHALAAARPASPGRSHVDLELSGALSAAPPPAPASAPAAATVGAVNTQADFGLSGALAADEKTGNVHNGVVLKWSEPPDAAVPRDLKWRLHVFKDGAQLEKPLHVYRQSGFLVGRDRKVADLAADHPSCSGQHAVLQFRGVPVPRAEDDPEDAFGPPRKVVKPYVMDLESTNGTFLNGSRLPPARYVEMRPLDVLRFGSSTREYVLMHDQMVGAAGK